MKIAYIILAHKYPEQLVRLIRSIADDSTSFFIHFDKRSSDEMYNDLVKQLSSMSNVHLLKRFSCFWGNFNIVAATIEGIRQLVHSNIDFDYAILLSGQDYLIKPINQIKEFLEKHRGKEFIETFSLASQNKWTNQDGCYQALNRIQHWHFSFRSKHLYIPIKRRFPKGLEPYGGSQWWCLSRDCIQYINDFVVNNSGFVNYFKYVFIPDETFFNTIVSNSPFKNYIVSDDLKYADWENPNPTPPAIICKNDFHKLANSPKLFARKFDMNRDVEILDLIDQKILGFSTLIEPYISYKKCS
ncbi:putative glycosyl transferase [Tolypothrix sp. NIES-4075]|uniref:beta-1,6-N-acetylglucosaminyltransferase n=1 Tax=Tolypothrix sp. NIES-4075 TaxID=2005459 RepID=UPI000B5D0073|nr:beta-1,6-N-acetylglucosaminyltransferase [Tolypothrix sp. NIES-4075]GAX40936.1 putative glycosyl transferase [Tolypothrix sp. NIES-4075]